MQEPYLTEDKLNALIAKADYEVAGEAIDVCILTLHSGFRVVGVSPGPLNPDNYSLEVGQKIAYDKAFEQLWQLEAYRITAEANKPIIAADHLANLPAGSAVVQIINTKLDDGSDGIETQGVLVGATQYDPKNPAHRIMVVIHNNREQIIEQALYGAAEPPVYDLDSGGLND
jgi:hypothetical protein